MELFDLFIKCGGKVTTDSRAIAGGEIFFALRGENFDGNAYAMSSLEKGAAYAVVNDDADLPDDARLVRVPDPMAALRELAICHREHFTGPVIGLTGTNGKTTTKELISAVLSRKFKVTATKGNLNNDIGVPLSVLGITPDTQIAVIEMGASHPDDIAKLVPISQPDYGLITNVGKAHLQGFGSFEGVKAAKGELYNWLGSHRGSLIFLNEDSEDLREMASGQPCHCYGYGINYQHCEILPVDAANPYVRIRIGEDTVNSRLVGAYNANNILAALAVGEYFGVPRNEAIAAIEAYAPVNNRSQLLQAGSNVIIADAYNANPSSMAAALENFNSFVSPRKLALLGDMRELGPDSVEEHRKIVALLEKYGIDACLVGEEFSKAASVGGHVKAVFTDSAALAQALPSMKIENAAVLVKGSRGIQMEKAIDALLELSIRI